MGSRDSNAEDVIQSSLSSSFGTLRAQGGNCHGEHEFGKTERTQGQRKWKRQWEDEKLLYAPRFGGHGIPTTTGDCHGVRRADGGIPLGDFDFASDLRGRDEDPCTTGARRPGSIHRTERQPSRSQLDIGRNYVGGRAVPEPRFFGKDSPGFETL